MAKSKSITPKKLSNQDKVLRLIIEDIDAAFDALDNILGKSNGLYNDLKDEYLDRPNNFDMETFRNRLRRFVKRRL